MCGVCNARDVFVGLTVRRLTVADGVQTGPDAQPMPPGLLQTESVKVNASTTAVTQYLYDQYGDLVQTTAPSGLVTKYTYDEVGRKKTETQISDTGGGCRRPWRTPRAARQRT